MGIIHCPDCDHHISMPCHSTTAYCPLCDKVVVDEDTWFAYIKSLDVMEMAQFLSDYRCRNCMRRGNSCFPGNTETWLLSKRRTKG